MKKPSKKILEKAEYYQYVIDGKTINLVNMERGQLLRALMQSIDVLDKVSSSLNEVHKRIDDWSDGAIEG